jgi:hypothetical protein
MPNERSKLAPLPVRLIAYALLTLIALAAIRVIDRHVMARANHTADAPSK